LRCAKANKRIEVTFWVKTVGEIVLDGGPDPLYDEKVGLREESVPAGSLCAILHIIGLKINVIHGTIIAAIGL